MAVHIPATLMGSSIVAVFATMLLVPASDMYAPYKIMEALGLSHKANNEFPVDLFEGNKQTFAIASKHARHALGEAQAAAHDLVESSPGDPESKSEPPSGATQKREMAVKRHRLARTPYHRLLPLPGVKPARSLFSELFAELRVSVRPHPKTGPRSAIRRVCMHGDESLPLANTTLDCPGNNRLLPDASNASAGVVFTQSQSPLGPPLLVDLELEPRGGDYEVEVERLTDSVYQRMALLAAGILLMYLAPHLGGSIVFYYTSGMSLTILALGLILTYQLIKALPIVGRKPAFFVTSGAWTVLVRYLFFHEAGWRYLKSLLGPDTALYAKLFVAGFLLVGAALGFWLVRRFVLAPNGTLDASTAMFTSVGLRFIAAVLIWESTVDPTAKLVFEVAVVILCWSPLPRWLYRAVRWTVTHVPALPRPILAPGRPSPGGPSPPGTPPGGKTLVYGRTFDPEPTRPSASKPGLNQPGLAAGSVGRFLTQEEFAEQGAVETERQLQGLFGSPEFQVWMSANHGDRLRAVGSPRPMQRLYSDDEESEEGDRSEGEEGSGEEGDDEGEPAR
eukprot:jgi/Mesvir1/19904/Mv13179-RA.1